MVPLIRKNSEVDLQFTNPILQVELTSAGAVQDQSFYK